MIMSLSEIQEYNLQWKSIQKEWDKNVTIFPKLYHLSNVNLRDSILQKGLIPASKNGSVISYENRIFLLTNDEKLHEIQEMTGKHSCYMDLWEIDNSKINLQLFLDEFAKNPRCCYTHQAIPSKYLTLVKVIEPCFE